jgi:Primase X
VWTGSQINTKMGWPEICDTISVTRFRIWLINKRLEQSRSTNRARTQTTNSTTIRWVEKLLQIPIDDHRKFVVWRILAPYLINIRKSSSEWAYDTIQNWLDICRNLKQLDFSPNYTVRYNIKSAKRNGYLPISLEKLKIENSYLYHVLVNSQVGNKL